MTVAIVTAIARDVFEDDTLFSCFIFCSLLLISAQISMIWFCSFVLLL